MSGIVIQLNIRIIGRIVIEEVHRAVCIVGRSYPTGESSRLLFLNRNLDLELLGRRAFVLCYAKSRTGTGPSGVKDHIAVQPGIKRDSSVSVF